MARSTLLLVDGDTKNLRVLEVSLRKAGYTVITAESGEDALDRLGEAPPSLVISDTQLPGIDGYEFCKRLKADPRGERLPFIFLTQQEAIQEKIRGLEMGVEEYLTKPILIKELMIRIKMVLQKKQREIFTDRDGQTTFKGNLADMAVVDLIQTMEMGRKSGVAQFSGNEGRGGAVYFIEGAIIDAEEGDSRGDSAVYALLGWSEGSFVVEFQTVERGRTIKESNQGLLMEGMRRVDEWNRIRTVIPDLTVAMVPDETRAASIRGNLSPMQSMALALMDGTRSVEDIRGALAMDDLEILSAVRQLVEMGGVRTPGGGIAGERVKLEDIPQPKAFGEQLGRPAEEKIQAPEAPPPEAPAPEAVVQTLEEEDELATTMDFGEAPAISTPDTDQKAPRPTLSYGEATQNDADDAQLEEEPPIELPPEAMEEDGEDEGFPPMELPPEELEEDGEVDGASSPGLAPEGEEDDVPPPIPPEEEEEEELSPIPEDPQEEDAPAVAEAEEQAREIPPPPAEEEAAAAPIIPDEDEEAAAIEDEEPPPQITAALTENTEERAGELTLLKDQEIADKGEPVYLLTPPTEEAAESEQEPPAAEEKKEEAPAAKPEPREPRKRGRKKKSKKSKKTKRRKGTAPEPAAKKSGTAEVIPFPNQPAVKKDDSPPAGRNHGGAEPAPRLSVAEAAAAAAARAGSLDPSEASINVIDEEFFNSDYMEDDLAAFDESLIVPAGPPSKLRMPAIIIIVVAIIGAGITSYFLATSPYIGDGPEHLRVDPASLARQAEERRKAETARREATEKEQAAFASGKKSANAAPAPAPAPDEPPLTDTPPPATEPDKPAAEPDKPAAEPDKPAAEPDKPAAEPDKPAAEPDKPAAGPTYDTLLAEGKALLKKYKKRNAMKKFQAAIKANPSGWEAMEQVALYNMEMGRMRTAYKLARKVEGINPEAPYAHLVIGGMLQERGKRKAARNAYGKFLKLCPSCRYAKDIRAVLKSM